MRLLRIAIAQVQVEFDPLEVEAKAGRPDDIRNVLCSEIERGWCGDIAERLERKRRRCIDSGVANVRVHARHESLCELVSARGVLRQVIRETNGRPVTVEEAPRQGHAGLTERAQAQIPITSDARLNRRARASGFVTELLDGLIERVHVHAPCDVVAATIPTRHPATRAGSQPHAAASGEQVLRNLAAGLTSADDQHATFTQLTRIAVLVGTQLEDTGIQPVGRPMMPLVRTCRHDHCPRVNRA